MISIIIPVFNREHLIVETINSITAQTYQKWECIIIDDGSFDNTIEVINDLIKEDSRFRLLVRPNKIIKGPSSCRNYAFERANGIFVQFFDSDDIMHPKHLELKMKTIRNNDLVVCKLKEFYGEFKDFIMNETTNELVIPKNSFEEFVIGDFPMMMVAPLWKKSVLQKYIPMREDMHILEDHELYARALFEKKEIAVINQDLIYYRIGETSSTNSFYKQVDFGLNSFFEAKRTVLRLSNTKKIKLAVLKMTLGFFRQALAERNFKAAKKCLEFINTERLCYNGVLKIKLKRISFFYFIFKIIKKGDTKFKPLFKI